MDPRRIPATEDPARQAPADESVGAQPGLPASTDPDVVRETLESASGLVPQPLLKVALEKGSAPAAFVDSAEGVTTYAGFNGDPRSKRAREWTSRRLAAQIHANATAKRA
jgi:hypothetical protein